MPLLACCSPKTRSTLGAVAAKARWLAQSSEIKRVRRIRTGFFTSARSLRSRMKSVWLVSG